MPSRLRSALRRGTPVLADITAALVTASLAAALAAEFVPSATLTVLYVPAVLFVAIRRGVVAAVAASVVAFGVFSFVFIEPRFEVAMADAADALGLALALTVAVAVGRLSLAARRDADEAAAAARRATAREREAEILAATASSILGAGEPHDESPLASFAAALPERSGSGLSLVEGERPDGPALVVEPFDNRHATAWLCGRAEDGWDPASLRRLRGPLEEICEIVDERARALDERARADELRRTDLAKTALLHAVSHDLRSPLTAIATAANAMSPARLPDDDHRALLEVIREESARLADLVDDLLDVSRIEAGAVHPQRDWCHVNETVLRAAALTRKRHDHPIEVNLPEDVLLIHADSVQLERVFVNLLDNAVKHSPPGTPVLVSGGTGGGSVHIRVTDSGRGIPLSRRRRVFDPFYRGRAGEGSGLGLTICRGFAEANGGSVRIQDALGGGTSFAVSFPLAAENSPA